MRANLGTGAKKKKLEVAPQGQPTLVPADSAVYKNPGLNRASIVQFRQQ